MGIVAKNRRFLCKQGKICLPLHLGQMDELSVPALKFGKATGLIQGSEHKGIYFRVRVAIWLSSQSLYSATGIVFCSS